MKTLQQLPSFLYTTLLFECGPPCLSTMSLPDLRYQIGLNTPNTARSAKLGFEPLESTKVNQDINYLLTEDDAYVGAQIMYKLYEMLTS